MRRTVTLLAVVGMLAGASACTSGSPSAKVTLSSAAPTSAAASGPAAAATSAAPSSASAVATSPAWDSLLSTVSADGTVSTATALQAFSLAFGPLPGVTLPATTPGLLLDATSPLRLLVAHWRDLTAAQRAAAVSLVPDLATLSATGAAPAASGSAPAASGSASASSGAAPAASGSSPAALGGPAQITVHNADFETVSKYQQRRPNSFYTELAQGYAAAIGAKVGVTLSLPITVTVTGVKADWAMETSVFSASRGYDGTPASCQIDIAANGDALDGEDVELALTHEVWHCFEGQAVGLDAFWDKGRPLWIFEGEAEWVGQTLVPTADYAHQFWPNYLNMPGHPLFTRSYSAVGFFSQLAQSGTDVWSKLIPVLQAGDNVAAFEASGATGDAFLNIWASGYFRDPSRGTPWDIDTPGITANRPEPAELTAPTERSAEASAQPYTVAVYQVNPVGADLERFVFTGHARVSDAGGHDYTINKDATMCTNPAGCKCPTGPQPDPPAQPLTPGPIDFAVTGDPTGNSGTVTGESLKDYCQTCPSSGTAIPAGTYSGPIAGTFLEALHFSGHPGDGSGKASFAGTLTIRSDGTNVYGTIEAKGPGNAEIAHFLTTNFFGGMKGNVYGSASDPMSKGDLDGNSDGTPTHSLYNASLHITSASCQSVSGDMIAMLQEITKPVAQYLTLSGTGTWTIPRKN